MARGFNGISDRIDYAMALSPSAQAQTFSIWLYLTSLAHVQYLFGIQTAGSPEDFGIFHKRKTVYFQRRQVFH